jgi:S1-C subfamily serine protease
VPLEFRSGPRRGESVELGGRIVLGRGEDCDVVLDDDKASRFHTALTPLPDGTVRVEDLGSTNGTYVDGRRITEATVLQPGVILTVGDTRLAVLSGPSATPPGPSRSRIERLALTRSARRTQLIAGAALAVAGVGALIGILFATGVVGSSSGPTVAEVVEQSKRRTARILITANGEQVGNGSGWVYDAERGLVVTNWHVVNGGDGFSIRLGDEKRERPAEVVGAATCEDLAVLRVADTSGLDTMPLGSQSVLRQGDTVVTVGYPGSLAADSPLTANQGVVSVVKTTSKDLLYTGELPNVIQIDAQFNPGNSGGPAVAMDGSLVGVTTFVNPSEEFEGQRYLIGVDRVREIVPELAEGTSLAWTGLLIDSAAFYDLAELGLPATDGILILGAIPGTPGAAAGIAAPALITAVDGTPVTSDVESYCRIVGDASAGESAVFTVIPAGSTEAVDIEVPFA